MLRALAAPAPYIALIASSKRAGLVLDYLRQEGVAEAEFRRIHAPAGLDLGAAAAAARCARSGAIALCGISRRKRRAERIPRVSASPAIVGRHAGAAGDRRDDWAGAVACPRTRRGNPLSPRPGGLYCRI